LLNGDDGSRLFRHHVYHSREFTKTILEMTTYWDLVMDEMMPPNDARTAKLNPAIISLP
jgi:hypothetical protein